MLEKIDKFIDKYLNWKVLLNLILAEICLLPFIAITATYNIPLLFKVIMLVSLDLCLKSIERATKSIKKA